jgi:hypothetical protein
MSHFAIAEPAQIAGSRARLTPPVCAGLIGFVYWLVFLLVLEPGNLAGSDGHDVGQEVLRMSLAALLGSSISPLVLASVLRFPVEGQRASRNAVVLFAGILLVSAGLIAASCVLADWFLAKEQRPFLVALRVEFAVNWLLVAFCTATLVALFHTRIVQGLCGVGVSSPSEVAQADRHISVIPVKVRGETMQLDLKDVHWIEAQGNYIALHTGSQTHLVRDSLATFESKLDPRDFVRVHRGSIVAVSRVEGMSPLGSGDANLRLPGRAEVRLSRKHRSAFLALWSRC